MALSSLKWLFDILGLGFTKKYIENLILRIEQIEKDDSVNIYSMADLVEKYPDVKDKILEVARFKFKQKSEGFDIYFTESSTKTFMWFGEGLKMIKALIEQIVIAEFATEAIVKSVIKTFSSAVATDDFVFKSYHDSNKRFEKYEVKEVFTGKSPYFEIAYLFLNVSARKKGVFCTIRVQQKLNQR